MLSSSETAAEITYSSVTSQSAGFDLSGAESRVNENALTYVAWTWDAGSSTVTNTAGSISSQVRANASAGFSVVTYSGNGVGGASVGHGLGVAPGFFVCKRRSGTGNWYAYHGALGGNYAIDLNGTAAASSNAAYWNNTNPSSTVITLSSTASVEINGSGDTYVIYAWAPVAGYSAFGSYTGNGSADGPFVYTGFRPKFFMVKASSTTGPWIIYDSKRPGYNPELDTLSPNSSAAEDSSGGTTNDIVSNGFKIRGTSDRNASGVTYIYAAFAEHPFATARAR